MWISAPLGGGVRVGTRIGGRRNDGTGAILVLGFMLFVLYALALVAIAIAAVVIPGWMIWRAYGASRRWIAVCWVGLALSTVGLEVSGFRAHQEEILALLPSPSSSSTSSSSSTADPAPAPSYTAEVPPASEPDVKVIVPPEPVIVPPIVFDRSPIFSSGSSTGNTRSPRTAETNPCADLQSRTYATLNEVRRAHALCNRRAR